LVLISERDGGTAATGSGAAAIERVFGGGKLAEMVGSLKENLPGQEASAAIGAGEGAAW